MPSDESETIPASNLNALLGSMFGWLRSKPHKNGEWEQNGKLNDDRERLRKLISLSQNLHRMDDADALEYSAPADLLTLTDFHYAVFSKADYFERTICSCQYKQDSTVEWGEEAPENWLQKSNYPLESDDVLASIIRRQRPVLDFEGQVQELSTDFSLPLKAESIFNPHIYEPNKHDRLHRLYLPIKYLSKSCNDDQESKNSGTDLVLGVLELAYRKDINPANPKEQLDYVQIYADVFAQVYYRLLLEKSEALLREKLRSHLDEQPTLHFLQEWLDETASFLKPDYGVIVLRTPERDAIDFRNAKARFGLSEADFKVAGAPGHEDVTGLISKVVASRKPVILCDFFSHSKVKNGNWQKSVRSGAGIPLTDEKNNLAGILLLYSRKPRFFNPIHTDTLCRIEREVLEYHRRKKRFAVTGRLTDDLGMEESTAAIYRKIAEALKDYFDARYVSVWERLPGKEKTFRLAEEAMEAELIGMYRTANLLEKNITRQIAEEEQQNPGGNHLFLAKKIDPEGKKDFDKFCQKNRFQWFVAVKVVFNEKFEVFFNVLSRNAHSPITSRTDEDFLSQLSRKTSLLLRNYRLRLLNEAYREVSAVLADPQQVTLQKVAEAAAKVTSADFVSVFPYRGIDIKLSDGVHFPAEFSDPNPDKNRKTWLVNQILQKGDKWFSSIDDYHAFIKEALNGPLPASEKNSFWERNQIQAAAAIRIVFEGKPVGVMFFNFKNKLVFDEWLQKDIMNFVSFAGVVIQNANYVESVREKLITDIQKFEKQHSTLRTENERIQRENLEQKAELANARQALESLIRTANRSSFYRIWDGVVHETKITLRDIEQGLEKIDLNAKKWTDDERRTLLQMTRGVMENKEHIENLLKNFDLTNQEPETFDVNQTIRDMAGFFRRWQFAKISCPPPAQPLYIEAVKAEISMVLFNLLTNAMESLRRKKKTVGEHFEGNIAIKIKETPSSAIIEITDDGEGIDNSIKERIFERGFTTKKKSDLQEQEGTGVGLYFVKEVLEREYNGTIEVISQKNQGATFKLEIPNYATKRNR